mmetsp:Transcript_36416/g.95669  ORF Transcript_36416/g.95669 Transcript_36416/m.95669 type:complete len:220 (-) Transcript_36416:152-811(-)
MPRQLRHVNVPDGSDDCKARVHGLGGGALRAVPLLISTTEPLRRCSILGPRLAVMWTMRNGTLGVDNIQRIPDGVHGVPLCLLLCPLLCLLDHSIGVLRALRRSGSADGIPEVPVRHAVRRGLQPGGSQIALGQGGVGHSCIRSLDVVAHPADCPERADWGPHDVAGVAVVLHLSKLEPPRGHGGSGGRPRLWCTTPLVGQFLLVIVAGQCRSRRDPQL